MLGLQPRPETTATSMVGLPVPISVGSGHLASVKQVAVTRSKRAKTKAASSASDRQSKLPSGQVTLLSVR